MSIMLLVVDDDPDSRFLAQRNLSMELPTATVVVVADAVLGLEQMERTKFDLVVTDYRMDPIDGLEFTRRIRATDAALPVVMRTAMNDMETRAQAAGVSYLLPWYRWSELGNTVKLLLASSTSERKQHT